MKKISSKIIVSFLLAIFLFGGIGFGVGELQAEGNNPPIGISAPINNGVVSNNSTATYGDTDPDAEEKPFSIWDLFGKGMAGFTSIIEKGLAALAATSLQLVLVPLLGVMTKMFAVVIDQSLQYTLNTALLTESSLAIQTAWSIIRNLFNMTFIFILLYSSIKMILGVAGSDTKKIIANVVTSALLINFSLFITKILIDAGNILAVSIYNMIIVEGTISAQIGKAFGIGILFSSTGVKCVFCTPYLVASILQVLGMLITVISFGYVAMLLIVRNASLMFLMAFSPIGFMGATIPKLKEYSDKWWKNLYGQVFVAPIFLIILLLILKIAPIFSTIIKEGAMEFEGASEGLSQTVNYLPVFKFLMIAILIIIAVKVTKEMSGVVGEMAGKVGSLAVGAALGAATGGAALLGRQFIGRGAAALAAKEGLINSAAQGGIRGFPAKMALRSANYASKASFDIRGTESFKKVTGFVGDQTGIKVDYTGRTNIQKGGYIATKEKKEKEMEARAKELANVDALKVDHWHDLTQDEVNAKIAERKAAAADAMNAQKKIIDDNKAKLTDTTLTAKQRAKIEKGIDDAEEKFEEEQKMKDFDTQSNEEKMRLEETIRKEMAKKQTKDAATNRLESVARNNSLANKRAASVIRGFIKANSKEKTDSDKLLEEISRNTKPPKS